MFASAARPSAITLQLSLRPEPSAAVDSRGFAHGFAVLSETADFFYKCDAIYSPETEITVLWNYPQLAIDWRTEAPQLSARDQKAPRLADIAGLPSYTGV